MLKENTAQYSEFQKLLTKADASKKAADALPLLNEAAALLGEMTARTQSIAALIDKAAALDISPEYRTYMGQEKELMRVHLDFYGVLAELTATGKTAWAQGDQLSASELNALVAEYNDLVNKANALATETQQKDAAAKQYYADNRIAEAAAESTSNRFWVPGVLVFAAVGSFIGWYRRRRRHQGPTSPKSLDKEMRGV